ncbi:unnamed protein product [Paramecium octaurelia]|uniref:Uncharacterized protein n=1 Tax=Paramecium octaurelia TaxID=43137 RepID=A0A8S1UY28_PAROT|nr:unnamed protein product [Paramecium octaurelia]
MLQINTQTLLAIALFQVLQPKFHKIQLQSIVILNKFVSKPNKIKIQGHQ